MSKVESLSISGFKSIRELKGFPLSALNVLIGANGAGKSNFLSLFPLLSAMAGQRFQLFVQTQGGPDALLHFGRKVTEQLHGEFHFGGGSYRFDLIPTTDNRLVFDREYSKTNENENTPETISNISHLVVNLPGAPLVEAGSPESALKINEKFGSPPIRELIGNRRLWHFCDTGESARVKQRHTANDNLILKTDAANLGAYLRMLHREHRAYYDRIVSTIRLVAPFFGGFVHRPGEPEFVELEWTQRGNPDTPLKAHVLSDGTLRFLCLATLLLQPVALLPDTILIDEPELGLHPYAIAVLADIFKQVAEKRQLIVSTQSVELVNELEPEDIIVVDQKNGASTFQRPNREELAGWLEEYTLGELWQRNILDGGLP
uniref:Predicted ATPase n=1 Tax=Candidatus Kentrum sp. FM TaxID=2126340 RepID=A0A450SA53_9GAMM|nr:MAG: Predicted ATPase [Candidatus Kentron sp. FM]VFJ48911.1 MAG: Predicted ATPase [Candidatus Kentron sp. FM]VFK08229.1 MAG: Predicted ATPase [Candidatus Kentron sp. FM]